MNTEPENPNDANDCADNPSPAEQQPAAGQPAAESRPAGQTQSFDPRRRLRELLSVPERDRSDEQWDEINELEIQLAPGNRVQPGQSGPGGMPTGGGGGGGGRHFQQKKHPPKGEKGGGGGGGGGGKRRPRPGNPNKPQA